MVDVKTLIKFFLCIVVTQLLLPGISIAQATFTLRGKVTGTNTQPLSGVSVSLKGTSRGVSTNENGEFAVEAKRGDVLVLSYVGYAAQQITVTDVQRVDISLTASGATMNEVVVTALGIRKERKSLGYSVTEVKGEELTQAREINVASALEGKVAGLNVSSVSGGAGSSSNVIIRGLSSLNGNNQPLYVVNGVPMESSPGASGAGQYQNGQDVGDAIGNLNPDDIESISVLKGAAASALYGYRAKAGVILITTKAGRGNGGIEVNSNYVAEQVYKITDFQTVYGQGSNNLKPASQADAFNTGGSSWGAKLDGSNVVQFDGVARPYVAQTNNLKNFFKTGGTFTNTVAFNQGFTGGNIRLSASNLSDKSPIPNASLNRQTFNLTTTLTPVKNLVIDARANYILEHATNRPILGDLNGNIGYNVIFLPTSVDVDLLSKRVNNDGSEYAYSANTFATNPWFSAYNFQNATFRNRLISSISARYNFENGFFAQFRAGNDAYTTRITRITPSGTAYRPLGDISEQSSKFNDINVDGLIGKTFKAGSDFTITPNLGASFRRTKSETIFNSGSDFAVFGVYNLGNAKNKSASTGVSDNETQSVYGTLEVAYKSLLYVTASGRSDWFSPLATPGKENKLSIFYPSVSSSFVFSELLKNDWLTFGKLRAGYAVVGAATGPYQTQLSYGFMGYTLNGRPLGQIPSSNIPNASLQPSQASELEVGTEMRLFKNRVGVDVTWYNKKSKNEILSAPTSTTSGYSGAVLNIGELQNTGVEALISVSPVKTPAFTWTTSVNGAINNNKVVALAAGQAQLQVGIARSGVGFTSNIVGLPSIQVMAFDYKYDAEGKIMKSATGVPLQGNLIPMGSAYGKWTGGWNNDLIYKRLNISFLIDGKFGGKVFSGTDYTAYTTGLHKATLENREGTFGTNLNAQTYYSTLASNVSKMFVYDASFIKFRQLVIGYSFPAKMFTNVIKGVNLSLVGRNLFTIMKKTENIDPEASYSVGAQGLEAAGVPPSRTYGVNLNFKF